MVLVTVVAEAVRPRIGEPLLVVAITIALPTLWLNALATLVAIVPIVVLGSRTEPMAKGIAIPTQVFG